MEPKNAQMCFKTSNNHANEARQKRILAAATARSSQSRMISKPFRSHLGRHPAAQAKRFRELCKIWSTTKCMPIISLLVEIIDSDAPNHDVFRVLDGAKKMPKREVNWWSREQHKPNGLTYNEKIEKHVIIAAEVLNKWKQVSLALGENHFFCWSSTRVKLTVSVFARAPERDAIFRCLQEGPKMDLLL